MDCPECGLVNPPIAQRCDCGYDFDKGRMDDSYVQQAEKKQGKAVQARATVVMPTAVCVIQGLVELLGLSAFLAGFFLNIGSLMILGGGLVVLDDIVEMVLGVLNPLFPVVLAGVLAVVFTPWYVGVFWASAAFKVLGVPTAFVKIFSPGRFVGRA